MAVKVAPTRFIQNSSITGNEAGIVLPYPTAIPENVLIYMMTFAYNHTYGISMRGGFLGLIDSIGQLNEDVNLQAAVRLSGYCFKRKQFYKQLFPNCLAHV